MLTYSKISGKPAMFRSFTGLKVGEFDKLYCIAEREYGVCEEKRLWRRNRKRAIGAGRKFKLELKERLIMLLLYYRLYMTYALSGFLFDLHESSVCRDITRLEPLLSRCMPLPEKVHRETKRIGMVEELLRYYPEMKAFLDATEQQIPRPKNKRKRKSHYSGKKKKHTVKTQILVNRGGLITHKSGYRRGRIHDYELWKRTHPSIPPDVEVGADSGYQGIRKDFPEMKSRIPKKSSKLKPLTRLEKKRNKDLSRDRVVVEHAIARVKKFNIIGQTFRNRLSGYDAKTSIVAGLVNFRLMLRQGADVSDFVG